MLPEAGATCGNGSRGPGRFLTQGLPMLDKKLFKDCPTLLHVVEQKIIPTDYLRACLLELSLLVQKQQGQLNAMRQRWEMVDMESRGLKAASMKCTHQYNSVGERIHCGRLSPNIW